MNLVFGSISVITILLTIFVVSVAGRLDESDKYIPEANCYKLEVYYLRQAVNSTTFEEQTYYAEKASLYNKLSNYHEYC